MQIVNLARTTLRNIIGTLTLKSANSERGKINEELRSTLLAETANWGIEILRTELKEIDPPQDVQETMNKVVKAENEKIAAVDFATATETQADGQRRAEIKKAEGVKQAKILQAEGEAEAIRWSTRRPRSTSSATPRSCASSRRSRRPSGRTPRSSCRRAPSLSTWSATWPASRRSPPAWRRRPWPRATARSSADTGGAALRAPPRKSA